MKLRGIAILVLAVSAPCLFGTVVSAPVVITGRSTTPQIESLSTVQDSSRQRQLQPCSSTALR